MSLAEHPAPRLRRTILNTFLWRLRRYLGWIGRLTRRRLHFTLTLASLTLGIIAEAFLPHAWRRPVRAEFWRMLRLALGSSLVATCFVAALVGFAMVYQALYWLRVAGEEKAGGALLVSLLLREVTPLLVGVIVLGRAGTVMLTELGQVQILGQGRAVRALGLDPFLLLVLPRGVACSIASYTLGMVFVLTALLVGFICASLFGAVQGTLWSFFDRILLSTAAVDFVIFPVKMLAIGMLVATTCCLTALSAVEGDDIGRLIGRGFMRGMLVIMLASTFLSLAA